ncbi:unnamed protein product [Rotaria sp. Silwood2]|nr:unnamed protein product [Rotaria sp. Silwood2]CAF4447692.1 unnamed protein product [Rotaria sp. Silwood2]
MVTWESDDTETETTLAEKGTSWLPIIIIFGSILLLLLIGVIFLFLRKRRAPNRSYNQAAISEQGVTITTRS